MKYNWNLNTKWSQFSNFSFFISLSGLLYMIIVSILIKVMQYAFCSANRDMSIFKGKLRIWVCLDIYGNIYFFELASGVNHCKNFSMSQETMIKRI